MSAYTDKASVENYLLTSIDTSFNSQVTDWIAGISQYIDNYTSRTFVADSADSTRLFEGRSNQRLLIDDCVAISKVEHGDRYGDSFVEIASADYQVLPYNYLPITCVALKRRVWCVGIHRITGKWGYSVACPADIKFVATVLTAGIINTHVHTGTAKRQEAIGSYKVTYYDDHGITDYERVLSLLDGYRRISL